MNAKLIEEIAKFLGKNAKWVIIVITTGGAAIIIWYLDRRIKSLEKKKAQLEKIAKTYEDKIGEFEQKLQKENETHGNRIKEYNDIINDLRKALDEAFKKVNQYAKDIEKAKNYKTQLSISR